LFENKTFVESRDRLQLQRYLIRKYFY